MSYPVEGIERIEQHLHDSSKLADEIENLIDRDVKRETLGQRILYWCARRIACYKIARAFGSSRLNAIFKMWQKRYYLSPKRWLPPKGNESGMIYSDEAKREAKIRRQLEDIAGQHAGCSGQIPTLAEALLIILARLDKEDEYQREQAEYD